jgi:hypothetical protein
MSKSRNIEYKVVLVFPGFGEERENAEQIIEEALHYLNTEKDEPGMRFAYEVSARLEIVPDAEQVEARLRTEDDLALLILHDLAEDEQNALLKECEARQVPACITVPAGNQPRRKPRRRRLKDRILKVVFRERSDEPRCHRILDTTLTGSLDDDPEELGDRVAQLITVMALGVMEFHWRRNPPKYAMPE